MEHFGIPCFPEVQNKTQRIEKTLRKRVDILKVF